MNSKRWRTMTWVLILVATTAANGNERLLMTGGALTIEGNSGGGIVPWATLAGYGTTDESGGAAFATRVDTGDYALDAAGVAYAFDNRVQVSYARQRLHLPVLKERLNLPTGAFDQEIFGLKARLVGDLIHTPWPQVALGLEHKRQRDFLVPSLVGARDDSGTDVNLVASKLFLAGLAGRNVLANIGVRATRANQTGLLGFGGDREDAYRFMLEASTTLVLDRHWAVGMEFRQKPDNLGFAHESDWADAFVAWFPNKRWSFVAAHAELGDIATLPDQRGWYLSVQGSF